MSENTPKKSRLPDLIDSVLLALLVVVMCSQLDIRAIGKDTLATDNYNTKRLYLALSDVSLVLVFGWFAVRTTLLRAWKKLWWPPLPCWALIFALLVALFHSPHIVGSVSDALANAQGFAGKLRALITKETKEAVVGIVQWTAYFLAAPLLFVNLIIDRRSGPVIVRRRLAFHAFAAALLLNIAAGLLQRFSGSDAPHGLFGSPNIYGAFLAFALPVLLAHTLSHWTRTVPALVVTLLCLAGALYTLTSAWAAVALVLGLIAAAVITRRESRGALVMAVIVLPLMLLWRAPSHLRPLREESIRISSPTQIVKKQLVEWYAAFGGSVPGADVFATGVGPDNYQFNIGSYYSRLPNEEKMPADSNNLYLVQMASIGALGLGALFWMFLHFGGQAVSAVKENRNEWMAGGVLASLTAFAFVNLFHATIVRGVAIAIAFVLSLAIVALKTQTENEGVSDESV